MGMKTPCLGAHSGSLKKTLVARTHNLGAPGAWAPVRQQPCVCPVIDHEFRHHIVKVAVDPRGDKFMINYRTDALKTDINLFF